MTLGQKQRLFARLVGEFLQWIYAQGYEVSFGDAYRDPRVFGQIGQSRGYGRAKSNHKRRLAIDLNLFKDGEFLEDTESHRPLGEKWESMHELCKWGGHYNDGNHYSFEHEGQQ